MGRGGRLDRVGEMGSQVHRGRMGVEVNGVCLQFVSVVIIVGRSGSDQLK